APFLTIRGVFRDSVQGCETPLAASGLIVFVNTNGDACAISRELVRRNFKVVRCRHVGKHPTGQVEGRTMAWAEETALPVCREPRTGASRQLGCGGTAEMGTDAHCNEVFRIARTVFVFSVGRSEPRAVRIGIGQLGIKIRQCCKLLLCASQDPYGLATPFHCGHLAWLQPGDVEFDRSASRTRPFRGCK